MYYYILESPANRAVRTQYQRLRDLLTNLGIGGEMVVASPARTPAELTEIGLEKGYSTIVAVGADGHIDTIATTLKNRAVLGIVPIEASPEVVELVGTNDLKQACEVLKQRRVTVHSLVLAEPDRLLFLDALIRPQSLAKVNVVVDNRVRANAYFQQIRVTRTLEVIIESSYERQVKKVLGLFAVKGDPLRSYTRFHGRVIRILTEPELSLTVAGQSVAETPIQFRLVPDALKLITRRGTLLE
jgi:diacylglycerol kinase family enzyme